MIQLWLKWKLHNGKTFISNVFEECIIFKINKKKWLKIKVKLCFVILTNAYINSIINNNVDNYTTTGICAIYVISKKFSPIPNNNVTDLTWYHVCLKNVFLNYFDCDRQNNILESFKSIKIIHHIILFIYLFFFLITILINDNII